MVTQEEIIKLKCPVCKKKTFRFFSKTAKFTLVRCATCGKEKRVYRDISKNFLRTSTKPISDRELFKFLKKNNPELIEIIEKEKLKLREKVNKWKKKDRKRKKNAILVSRNNSKKERA